MRKPDELNGSDKVLMVGLDFGSTTSSVMVAYARVGLNCATGRTEFGNPDVIYRSSPVFTPFRDENIDEEVLSRFLDEWLEQSGIDVQDIFAGGTIITGLAAQKDNAATLARMISGRIGESVIATADDPCLESWLAFMGSCSALSRRHAETPIINFDIGGGTTNPALGLNGNVLRTGCYYVGARHFQFVPGSYILRGTSSYGRALLEKFSIRKSVGDRLEGPEINAILDFYINALEAIATGRSEFFDDLIGKLHEQVPFIADSTLSPAVITFSGGVGELIYLQALGESLPGTTFYGDLGIDLAQRILTSPILSANSQTIVPENLGRATVYGLTLHSTEVSGSTLFLPHPETLPFRDLPIVVRLPFNAAVEEIRRALSLIKKSCNGACIQIVADGDPGTTATNSSLSRVKGLGMRLAEAMASEALTFGHPIVLLIPDNCGHVVGNYATNWKQLPVNLIVIDEIPDRNAQFVNIGRPHNNIVPVSFYGMY